MSLSAALLVLATASCGGNGAKAPGDSDAADTASAAVIDSAALAADDDDANQPPMPKAADELFDDFIFNFAASRKLQMERIVFPLPSVNGPKKELIGRSAWKMEYFFMRQGYYTLLFDNERHMEVVKDTAVHHAVVEKIYFNTSSVIQYVFDRHQGAWMLVEMNTIPISASSNASFLTFFHRFATDKEFQSQSLGETVAFVGPDPDDDFAQMEGVISADTWEAFAPELPQKMIYNIIYGQPHREGTTKVFVLRGIANGLELRMTFRRIGGEWKLTKLNT